MGFLMLHRINNRQAAWGRGSPRARAAAVVEFAVILPLLLVILFGIIEYGYVFMVRLTLQNAAREGCRIAVLQTTVEPYSEVSTRVEQIMATTGISSYGVAMTHATDPCNPMETVTVSVPYTDVSLMGGFFGEHDYDLIGAAAMRKEGMGSCAGGGEG
jgi:uncharacterized membrane protein